MLSDGSTLVKVGWSAAASSWAAQVSNIGTQLVDSVLQSATRVFVVLEELLVPTSILQVEATASLGTLTNGQSPGLSKFVICFVFCMIVLESVPCGKAVDDLGNGIEILERECGLRFVRREEVRGKVLECFDELHHRLADSVVGIVGRGAVAEGERFLEGGLVFLQDREGRLDTGTRSHGDDLMSDCGVLVADVLQEVSHFIRRESFEKTGQVEGTASGDSGAAPLGRA